MKVAFALDRELGRVFAADDGTDLGTEWRQGKRKGDPGTLHHVRAPEGTTFTAAALHPDGRRKALGTARGEVYLQSDVTGTPTPLDGLNTEVRLLRFSADGRRLLGTCQDELRVWDADTGERLRSEPTANVASVAAISPDGKRVAARFDRKAIFLFEEGQEKGVIVYPPEDVSLVEFTPDGTGLAVGTREWGLTVYPLEAFENGKVLSGGKRYVGHTSPVTSVGFSPDGTRIASGAADGSVRVWDVVSGTEAIGLSAGTEAVRAVWFADDGKLLVALPETGPPMLFDGSPRFLTLRSDKPPKELVR
jgi:WD40 repeat protein